MVSFANDYSKGAHPAILKALAVTNEEAAPGYGADRFCESAAARIREACDAPQAKVFFLTGGTQTNAVVLSAITPSWSGVIAPDTGHISVHEAGAIEATGHKVLTLPDHKGKLDPDEVKAYLRDFNADGNHEHMVFPGSIFISYPTELGSLYSLTELESFRAICDQFHIPLYLDGARLGYGLAANEADITLPDIARLVDVFYIGGTKIGTLCGEAVVFPRGNAPAHFLTHIKQHGALLAKGRLLGIQFDVLFTDNLYQKISRNAIERAHDLKRVLTNAGFQFFQESPTNQQFLIVENTQMEALSKLVQFSFWERYDDTHTVIRFVTDWATTPEEINELERLLEQSN